MKNKRNDLVFTARSIESVTQSWGIFGRLDSMVFLVAAITCFGFVIWGAIDAKSLGATMNSILGVISKDFGWLYLLSVFGFVVFLFWLAFGRYGSTVLGKDGDKPEYSNFSWFAMLFGAGMGIGLVFWSIAEPLYHYTAGPAYAGAPLSSSAAEWAMAISFFHWGISAWAVYVVIGIPMAFLIWRKGLPALISSMFYPIMGDKIYGPIGKTIDIITLVITFFGLSTTVGMGTMQLASGISFNYGVALDNYLYMPILAICCICYLCSACLPIEKGIKVGSDISMICTLGLMLFIFIAGPTTFILDNTVNATGLYLQNFIRMSLWTDPVAHTGWPGSWTIFYWAWWITWAPFVGMFIAKISKGRTIREFIIAALIVPSIFDAVFFSIFGSTALNFEMTQATKGLIMNAVNTDVSSAIYVMMAQFPLVQLIIPILLFVAFTFFVVSIDSGTIVLGMLSSGGDESPRTSLKILWGIALAGAAAIEIFLGGIKPVQTLCIIMVLPFVFIMIALCYSTIKMLRQDCVIDANVVQQSPALEENTAKLTSST
ncbi:BCCT family transporter [Sporomusa malonica]|uniref:Glycine betaine transporter n=1 Tax=Sporomusa malonica TaxID=112901 RepID=A0A1W1ZBY9_9FIRM|nr:BCCT family transporter [Sporomusa malonica]SMC45920.1 glycine betaine transporter [Sporomusa malonica]